MEFVCFPRVFTCKSILIGQNKQCQHHCPLSSSMLNPTHSLPEKLVNLKIDNEQNSLKLWRLGVGKGCSSPLITLLSFERLWEK